MKLPLYDNKGKKTLVEVDVNKSNKKLSDALLQYLHVFFTNKRQGTSKAKNRAEVSGGGRKPWRQKGTGRARHGSIRSPLWVGGGASHGPTPTNYTKRLNKKIKKSVFTMVMEKLNENENLFVIDPSLKKIKTKEAVEFLKNIDSKFIDKKYLLITKDNEQIIKSFNNVKNIKVKQVISVNTFDLLKSDNVIISISALEEIKNRLK